MRLPCDCFCRKKVCFKQSFKLDFGHPPKSRHACEAAGQPAGLHARPLLRSPYSPISQNCTLVSFRECIDMQIKYYKPITIPHITALLLSGQNLENRLRKMIELAMSHITNIVVPSGQLWYKGSRTLCTALRSKKLALEISRKTISRLKALSSQMALWSCCGKAVRCHCKRGVRRAGTALPRDKIKIPERVAHCTPHSDPTDDFP